VKDAACPISTRGGRGGGGEQALRGDHGSAPRAPRRRRRAERRAGAGGSWTALHGWHDLPGRLLGRARDFREAYRDLVREWRHEQYVDAITHDSPAGLSRGAEHVDRFRLRGRTVEEVGVAPDGSNMPLEIRDRRTKEPLWRFGQPDAPEFPWACNLRVETERGWTRVEERATGRVLARFAVP